MVIVRLRNGLLSVWWGEGASSDGPWVTASRGKRPNYTFSRTPVTAVPDSTVVTCVVNRASDATWSVVPELMTSLLGIRVALDAEIRTASQLSRRIGSGKKDKRYFVFEGTQFKYAAIPQTQLWFASIIRLLRPQIVNLANPDSAWA